MDSGSDYMLYFKLDDGSYDVSSFSIAGNSLDTPNSPRLTNLQWKREKKTGWQRFVHSWDEEEEGTTDSTFEQGDSYVVDSEDANSEKVAAALNALVQELQRQNILE
jgi:argininosuccinate synthase